MTRSRAIIALGFILAVTSGSLAAGSKLDGAYKLVAIKVRENTQTEDQVKGMLVVHGRHMAFVRAAASRQTWKEEDPEEDRNKKIIAAFQGLAATCGSFELQDDTIALTQHAQANPSSMGITSKWRFKLEGSRLTIKPDADFPVEFIFERLPDSK